MDYIALISLEGSTLAHWIFGGSLDNIKAWYENHVEGWMIDTWNKGYLFGHSQNANSIYHHVSMVYPFTDSELDGRNGARWSYLTCHWLVQKDEDSTGFRNAFLSSIYPGKPSSVSDNEFDHWKRMNNI